MDAYIGEIRLFAGTFTPRAWASCDGQLLAINDNQALFSLLGTTYGGDGVNTFALPDMRGRLPVHAGQGAGLTDRPLGERIGQEQVQLTVQALPPHTHAPQASGDDATAEDPSGLVLARGVSDDRIFTTEPPSSAMSPQAIASTGAMQPHENEMPFLCVQFIICLEGLFPPRQ